MRKLIPAFAMGAILLCYGREATAADHQTIPLWPNGAPGEKATTEAERDTNTPNDRAVAGKPIIRLSNVTEPSMTLYPAPKDKNTGAGVVVFPGGGYRILAYDLEGTEICEWLNSIGITAVLVKYRVPEPKALPRYQQPLQDAQRAVGMVRSHAEKWGVDPQRIGVLGFSAGGHLSAVLSNASGERIYPTVDAADQASSRPDFTILVYPAYLSVNDKGEVLAPEVKPSSGTPPTFIVQAENDHPFIGGTLLYYRALTDAKVTAEMHLYSAGGHGYGLRHTDDPVTNWPQLAEAWLRYQKILK
jgi:acetyl esterase/lipase